VKGRLREDEPTRGNDIAVIKAGYRWKVKCQVSNKSWLPGRRSKKPKKDFGIIERKEGQTELLKEFSNYFRITGIFAEYWFSN
jgi:hypothetical protein